MASPSTRDDSSSSIVRDLCSSIQPHVDIEELSKKQSDKERMRFVLENAAVQDKLKTWMETQLNLKSNKNGKDKEIALKFKDAGNTAFGKSQYEKSLQLYNQCITYMPHDNTKDVSIAYANRSACLFYMSEISLAQQDVKLAFSLNYPKELHYKLYERYGRCFLAQGKTNEACKRFKLALAALQNAVSVDPSKISKIKKTLEQLIKANSNSNFSCSSSDSNISEIPTANLIIPELTGGQSQSLRCASSRLTLTRSETQGRYITANQDIKPGDVLIVQKAYVSTLLPEWYHQQCYQCYASMLAPIACKSCITVSYCSVECRDKAWISHHQFECQILGILKCSGISVTCYMALRLVTQTGLKELRRWAEMAEKTEEKEIAEDGNQDNGELHKTKSESESNSKSKTLSSSSSSSTSPDSPTTSSTEPESNEEYRADENSLFQLVTHSRRRGCEDIFQRTIMASFLLALLKTTKNTIQTSISARRNFFESTAPAPNLKQEQPEQETAGAMEERKQAQTENNDDGVGSKETNDTTTSLTKNSSSNLNVDELTVGTILLRSLQFLQFNAHEVAAWDSTESKSVFLGGGLYLTLALFNHSCDPAIVRYFVNDTVVVRAVRTIFRGEEVTENYGPMFTSTRREERRATLKNQYWFDCSCICCREDWPTFENLSKDTFNFRCSFCHRFLAGSNDEGAMGLLLQCRKCKRPTNILKSLKDLQASEGKVHDAIDFINRGRDETALGILLQNIGLLDSILLPPFKDYHFCQEMARKCILILGNRRKSRKT